MRLRLTHGVLPSVEQFNSAFDAKCPDNSFSFGKCPRMGTCTLSRDELWQEIVKATNEYTDKALDWAGSVLYILEIEWV